MKCERAEDQFSQRYDNQLSPDAAKALDQHLAACPACHAAYESFAAAVTRLRSLKIAATPPAYAEQVSAAVFAQRAPLGSGARHAWRRPILLVLSHAAAVLLGWGLLHFAARMQHGDDKPEPIAHVEPPAPVVVEVPVEKLVEVRVEVPVEVVKEVIKEVPVERIEYVDRPVPHPLQPSLDLQQAIVADLAGAFREALLIARLASQAGGNVAPVHDEPTPLVARSVAPVAANGNATRAPMVVVREDGHVRIRTYGAAAEVVPSLIAALDDPDRELSAAAEQHLDSIRSRLEEQEGLDPTPPSATIAASQDSRGGIRSWWNNVSGAAREEPAAEPTTRERWQGWWNARSLAHADTRAQ